MKRITLLIAGFACLLMFTADVAFAQWTTSGTDIYNTNTGNVGIGTTTPAFKLDVQRFGNPQIRVINNGGAAGATFRMTDQLSGADFAFKSTSTGGFKIRDMANTMDVFFIESNSLANALYIKQGGNVGIGTTNPLEKLDVNGAVRIGNTPNSNAGTLKWDGSNFWGYNGTAWLQLDLQQDNDWMIQPGVPGNPELVPMLPPASISMGFPGAPNPFAFVYIPDLAAPGIFPHQLALETITGLQPPYLNVSQLYRVSDGANPIIEYTEGIFGPDQRYKICIGPVLTPTTQGDNTTMFQAHHPGIIDLPNQSRVRAYQAPDDNMANWQLIFPLVWTPINFDSDLPLNQGWDQQSEFTIAVPKTAPAPPVNAFFTAAVAGYYQVNARTEFELDVWNETGMYNPVVVNPNSYVRIAIWIDDNSGVGYQLHAIGNHLQIAEWMGMDIVEKLYNNNAPNVADVVYLKAGDKVAIYVWHDAATPMNLRPGSAQTYVSIHKAS